MNTTCAVVTTNGDIVEYVVIIDLMLSLLGDCIADLVSSAVMDYFYSYLIHCRRYNLQARAQNVAIPSGIVNQLESGELNITFYIQFDDGSILSAENLTAAVEVHSYL